MSLKRKLVIAYLFCLHLLALFMLVKSDFLIRIYKTLGGELPRVERFDGIDAAWNRLRNLEAASIGHRVYFIGDSNMNLVDVTGISPYALQLSMGNDTAKLLSERLAHYKRLHQARAIVLAIGQNDLLYRSATGVPDDIARLLARMAESVPIVLVGLLPVDEGFAPIEKRNADIVEINKQLRRICSQRSKRCVFVDAFDKLSGADNNLRRSNHVGDGVHLSVEGSVAWANEIRRAVQSVIE